MPIADTIRIFGQDIAVSRSYVTGTVIERIGDS
jgi:hypothetical protein